MQNEFIKHFLVGFFSIFSFGPIQTMTPKEATLNQYFEKAGRYLNSSLKKLNNQHERN
jgi:hypothetical protein